MTKKELVESVAKQGEMSNKDAEKAVELVLETLKAVMKSGDTAALRGFGTFGVRSVAAKNGRNPVTGEKIVIPARKRPFWKPAKNLLTA